MAKHRVYLSFGRHGRYGDDTAIMREDMLKSYIMGQNLQQIMPCCAAVYYSPLARAEQTAQFQALGLGCAHLLECDFLHEDCDKFSVRKFINQLIINTDENVGYYHMVTHQPVVEKLGLPFLSAGEVCLLNAENWTEMLADNFAVQVLKLPEITPEFWQKLDLTLAQLENLSAVEIYQKLQGLS